MRRSAGGQSALRNTLAPLTLVCLKCLPWKSSSQVPVPMSWLSLRACSIASISAVVVPLATASEVLIRSRDLMAFSLCPCCKSQRGDSVERMTQREQGEKPAERPTDTPRHKYEDEGSRDELDSDGDLPTLRRRLCGVSPAHPASPDVPKDKSELKGTGKEPPE